MKYVIDLEKIIGINLWKAKGFKTLAFDEKGLMKMVKFEDELRCYFYDLRNEIYSKKHEIELLVKTHKKLRDEKTELRFNMELQGKDIYRLKKENEELNHKIKSQKGIIKKQGKDISKLQKENKKLKYQLEDTNKKCRYIEWEKYLCNREYTELKKEHDKLIDRIFFGKDN